MFRPTCDRECCIWCTMLPAQDTQASRLHSSYYLTASGGQLSKQTPSHSFSNAQSKSSHQRPAGLLQPLPVPQRPWSHIAIDFVTDLPNSRNYTTILTVIDRFSKACRLIPLPKLPTAFETAEALLEQVFRFYGLSEDIISDRGPQFTSRVWRAFCQQLNINVNLTSGYHPQSNGQVERLNQEITQFLRSYCHQN